MITAAEFQRIRQALGQQAEDDIAWAENCSPPLLAETFALEVIFVICNSGMKNTVARKIYDRIVAAIRDRTPIREAFGHKGKVEAITFIWHERHRMFNDYLEATDKLAFFASLPWIGGITKFHLAKNFGLAYAKPDVHLQRLADQEGTTAQALCERLARDVGLGVNAIDTVLWRACANGVIDSRTGRILA